MVRLSKRKLGFLFISDLDLFINKKAFACKTVYAHGYCKNPVIKFLKRVLILQILEKSGNSSVDE